VSPIRKESAALYPKEWKAISAAIRARSGGRCKCAGECGLHHERRCEETQASAAKWAHGKIVLTVAHLNHNPADCHPENLKAMCQRCHLRYDRELHQRHSAETRRAKKQNGELFREATT
jgi:hypothetical protein